MTFSLSREDLEHVLRHTQPLWSELRGKRVFLTGGSGFFGRWLIESYLRAHDEFALAGRLVVLTRRPDELRRRAPELCTHPALQLHAGDQRDFAFPEGRFEIVIHAAVEYGAPLTILQSNVTGVERVLAFAAERAVQRVLLVSSGAVYGPQPVALTHVPEDYRGAPDPTVLASAYGEAKRISELLGVASAQAHAFQCTIARCFAFVGPYLPLDGAAAIGNFMNDALHGRAIQVLGDGTTVRSYLHAADLAVWLWTILISGASGRAYNVGSDRAVDLGSVARRVAGHASPVQPVQIAKLPVPGKLPDRYVPSTERAQRELGLHQHIDLDDAIDRSLAWQRRR